MKFLLRVPPEIVDIHAVAATTDCHNTWMTDSNHQCNGHLPSQRYPGVLLLASGSPVTHNELTLLIKLQCYTLYNHIHLLEVVS